MSASSKPSLFVEQKRVEAIIQNKKITALWEEKKKAHEEVQNSLKHYEGKLQEKIMVPLGKRGLMRGRIVNTNQVFVSIGAGWFTKVCSADAQMICSRRILECSNMMDKLEKERKRLEGWTALSEKQVFATEDTKEIIEPYNETEEEAWRKKHAEKVKHNKQVLAQVRQQLKESRTKEKTSEEDLWKHLELLELQEEFEDELNRLGANSDNDSTDSSPLDSDDNTNSEEESTSDHDTEKEKRINGFDNPAKCDEGQNNKNSYAKQMGHSTSILSTNKIKTCKTNDNNEIAKGNKNLTKKRVTFEEDLVTAQELDQNKSSFSIRHSNTIEIGSVVEHSDEYIKCQRNSRPVSKFKSSKQKNST